MFFHDVTSMMMAVIVVWFSVARGRQPEPPDDGGHQDQSSGIDQKCVHWFPSLPALLVVLNSRSRLALVTTVTEDSDIAAPASIGLIRIPHSG